MRDITQNLQHIKHGDAGAAHDLLPLVYDSLRNPAVQRMAGEAPGHTLQPTVLVHEAYVRLVGDGTARHWDGRGHFFAAAAEAMRRILVESARRKNCHKRGGQWERVDIDDVDLPLPMPADELLALDEALDRLAVVDACAAEVVKLCFFVGLTQEEAAKELGISLATVERLWSFARAWLFAKLQKARDEPI
ncbi:MAG: sigma-70 family RNA polymerase sigma factor [Verrucomicrobiales bacterium]